MVSLESFFDMMGFLAAHAVSFALLSASAWVFGETVLRRLAIGKGRHRSMEGRWALAGTLGLGVIFQSMFVLGITGLLTRWVVLGSLALGHLICLRTWRSVLGTRGVNMWWIGLGGLPLAPVFFLSLYPPTGFDATVYHLPYARAFIAVGGLEFLPDLRFPVFP